jgi:hypothetical protein
MVLQKLVQLIEAIVLDKSVDYQFIQVVLEKTIEQFLIDQLMRRKLT